MRVKFILSLLLFCCAINFSVFAATSTVIFSPYKDTSINMNWNTNIISTAINGKILPLLGDDQTPSQLLPGNKTVTLAFATGTCTSDSWGGVAGNTLAKANIPLFVAHNINYIISTGGASGSFQCDSAAAMANFLKPYQSNNLIGLDFDIEGGYNQTQLNALMSATAQAIKDNPNLQHIKVSLTLATLAQPGSTVNLLGDWAIQAAQHAGLDFYVNLMVMDYGDNGCQKNKAGQCDMAASAIFAAKEFSKDYHIPFNRIELTPMIGENDTADEITTIPDAMAIAQFANQNQLAGLHYWSFDRDTPCSRSALAASPTCNNTATKPLQYDSTFLAGLGQQ
jgi:hypothetical protein